MAAPWIIALFRIDEPLVMEIGVRFLRLNCLAIPLLSVIVMTTMLLQTTDNPNDASLLSITRQGLFLIPLLYFLTSQFGILGLQLAPPLADLLTFVLALLLGGKWLRRKGKIKEHYGGI
jgi:Na+-driven multidrug efflux pump